MKAKILVLFVGVWLVAATSQAGTYSFTNGSDWNLGTYTSTNANPNPPGTALKLDTNVVTPFNHIWVALSGRDSVVRINTDHNDADGFVSLTESTAGNGAVLGEYLSHPNGMSGNPSRTTVDKNGDVWVGNRNEGDGGLGSITKISANPTGTITSSGKWTGSTFNRLDWSNAGGADTNGGTSTAFDDAIVNYVRTTGANIRHVSVDKDNNVWAGGGPLDAGDQVFQLYNGSTGAAVPDPDGAGLPSTTTFFGDNNTGGYGGLVDGNGVVWSAGLYGNTLTRMDPATGARMTVDQGGRQSYGLGIDNNGMIWNATWTNNTLDKINPDGTVAASYAIPDVIANGLRGVAVTPDNDVWVASSYTNKVIRVNNDGTVQTTIDVGALPTGVAVDSNGKVWVTNHDGWSVMRIDPATNLVDLTIDLGPNSYPYNYSDMTGTVLFGSTTPTGTWNYTQDSGVSNQAWDQIFWNTEAEGSIPAGTGIMIQARAANSLADLGLAGWSTYLSGAALGLTGQYLEVMATLTRSESGIGAASPLLSDLTITSKNGVVPEPTAVIIWSFLGALAMVMTRFRRPRN